ncbi:hypothetical protein MUK42_35184 [Musa troglodytarum]|uniref:Uncharacterized protein n=1 Tax=Musa troglodytarum TaxID=320322 RepID=A0A9E7FPG5_9LILI|nr:hypothetical protein MUK42_35184 [Musa troglodytarum]
MPFPQGSLRVDSGRHAVAALRTRRSSLLRGHSLWSRTDPQPTATSLLTKHVCRLIDAVPCHEPAQVSSSAVFEYWGSHQTSRIVI